MTMSILNKIRWNVSRHVKLHEPVESYIVSVPKSGRTWVRFFLQTYFCAFDNREFSLSHDRFDDPSIPRVLFTHDLFEHATERSVLGRLTGKQLIPRSMRCKKPVLLLVRDPRDVVVSLYFQLTRRGRKSRRFKGTISEMLRDPVVGIGTVVWAMNAWLEEWAESPYFRMVRYEDIRADPETHFRDILLFLGMTEINTGLLRQAVESARFENMQKLEVEGNLATGRSGLLRPGEPQDSESFKVRKGLVGGYKEYLSAEDIAFLEHALSSLNPRFGYRG